MHHNYLDLLIQYMHCHRRGIEGAWKNRISQNTKSLWSDTQFRCLLFYLFFACSIIEDGLIIEEVCAEDVCVSATFKKQSLLLLQLDKRKHKNVHTSVFLLFLSSHKTQSTIETRLGLDNTEQY